MKKLLSIQDLSCYGQCSQTVALPIVSACGVETVVLPTMLLSTHTCGFKGFTALDLYEENKKIINHWQKEQLVFDSIYTGYLGNKEQIEMVINLNKDLGINAPIYVDPVMADYGKLYPIFDQNYVNEMKKLVSVATCVVPNLTEACFLLDKEYKENFSEDEVRELLKALCKLGPKQAIITGISLEEGFLGAYAYDQENDDFFYHASRRIPTNFHGTGDVFASILFGNLTKGKDLFESTTQAVDYTYLAIKNTEDDIKDHAYGVHFETVLKYLND